MPPTSSSAFEQGKQFYKFGPSYQHGSSLTWVMLRRDTGRIAASSETMIDFRLTNTPGPSLARILCASSHGFTFTTRQSIYSLIWPARFCSWPSRTSWSITRCGHGIILPQRPTSSSYLCISLEWRSASLYQRRRYILCPRWY